MGRLVLIPAFNLHVIYFDLTSGSKISPFLSLGFQLKVEHHFPADPKYFDISN